MDWLARMNRVMDYIEEQLDGEVDYNEIARIVCTPPGLFQRMFATLIDVPLSEYVRRRRLTRAAIDLSTSDRKVIDIAVKYGYDSADAFTVAFKRQHGITPQAAREPGVTFKAWPKLSFSLILKGVVEMNYRIEQKPAFRIIGKAGTFSNTNDEQTSTIPRFWEDSSKDGSIGRVEALASGSVTGKHLLGVCYAGQNDGSFRYMIGAGNETAAVSAGMEVLDIPASTWAVFECIGPMPKAIQAVWERIMGEFLPNSDYQHAGTPDFELYFDGENDENYRSEVWIPVVKR